MPVSLVGGVAVVDAGAPILLLILAVAIALPLPLLVVLVPFRY